MQNRLKHFVKKIFNILEFYLKIFIFHKPIVLVYQMGKVGSKSIFNCLAGYRSIYALHVHYVDELNNNIIASKLKKAQLPESKDIYIGKLLSKYIFRKDKPVRIITIVREPIARNASAFFQNLELYANGRNSEATVEELIETFLASYDHDVPLSWFDSEFKKTCKVDVYEMDFPREKGWLRFSKNNLDCLIMKLEIPDNVKEAIIGQFLGFPQFKLLRSNESSEKEYARIYENFKNDIRFPRSYVEKMCGSKYMKHFYTDDEIKNVKEQWL